MFNFSKPKKPAPEGARFFLHIGQYLIDPIHNIVENIVCVQGTPVLYNDWIPPPIKEDVNPIIVHTDVNDPAWVEANLL